MVLPTHSNPNSPVLSHFSLTGKVALVTGGCRGIGLEAARGLVEAGAKVAITYTSTAPETASKIAQELSAAAAGSDVRAYKCDVQSKSEIEATIETVTRELGNGKLDIVVVNAGIAAHIPAIEYGEQDWKAMMDVNLTGAFWTAQAAAKVFQRQQKEGGDGRASIIFTASVSGILVNVPQQQAPYNASKAALTHLARSLAVEWVGFCRVNCISPGYIATDMIGTLPEEWRKKWPELVPATRFCEAAELKGSYVYLASEASSYITGANLVIDGGYSVL